MNFARILDLYKDKRNFSRISGTAIHRKCFSLTSSLVFCDYSGHVLVSKHRSMISREMQKGASAVLPKWHMYKSNYKMDKFPRYKC